jgi:AraC-like DNA-binding protein
VCIRHTLGVTSRKRRHKTRSRRLDRQHFQRLIEVYLKDCYAARSAPRVSEIADRAGRNRPTLSRLCLEIFGRPLGSVLREEQLQYAAKLLREGPLPVEEVAAEAAFGHRTTFFRLFKLRFGSTPAQYRERQRNTTIKN